MKFWDASALIPLFIEEPGSAAIRALAVEDGSIVGWWGSPVECCSAFARARRAGGLDFPGEDGLRRKMAALAETWTEIAPTADLRNTAARLLLNHSVRAADALQLAAALVWTGGHVTDQHFVCLDEKLRRAARSEGFTVVPQER